jgi:membrane protein insertase Oxa1/YidC/SpoIIIJ
MQQPNQRGFRAPQGSAPGTIRTKKHQLDKDLFTRLALGQVWRSEWWYALIPLVLFLLPAIFSFSWWWVAIAVIVTILFVALRSAQVVGLTRVEQGNPLFEKMTYEIDQRQILMKRNEREGMALTWDMIQKAKREEDAFMLWLQPPTASQLPGGWKGWIARTFQAPVFIHLPYRIFIGANDIKLMESLLRRKNLLA